MICPLLWKRDFFYKIISAAQDDKTEVRKMIDQSDIFTLYRLDESEAAALGARDYEYRVLGDGTVEITKYKGDGGVVEIPESIDGKTVSGIGDKAFKDRGALTEIVIPRSVKAMGKGAFAFCESLTNIFIPDSVTEIGKDAFSGCDNLTITCAPGSYAEKYAKEYNIKTELVQDEVKMVYEYRALDDGTVEITRYVGSGGVVEIPHTIDGKTVSVIGDRAFDSSNVTKAVIPDGVKRIGYSTFSYCGLLTEVVMPGSVTEIGDSAFNGCGSLTDAVIPDGVTEIGDWAFFGCGSLTKVVIPDGMTKIGNFVFFGCEALTEVVIPDSVTVIGYEAFGNCEALTKVIIPDSVTEIGKAAFGGCGALTEIVIPDSVRVIGSFAFSNCEKLTLKCTHGSYAEAYAKRNKIKFELIRSGTNGLFKSFFSKK